MARCLSLVRGGCWHTSGHLSQPRHARLVRYFAILFAFGAHGLPGAWSQPVGSPDDHWHPHFHAVGFDAEVRALAVYDQQLVAAGRFEKAGGVRANHIAQWNGSYWQTFADGFDGDVHALTLYRGDLIATGEFTTSGSTTVLGVARWDGSSWQALDGGITGHGLALVVHEDKLYLGGEFTRAGIHAVSSLAVWDGVRWQPVGPASEKPVRIGSLLFDQGQLVAAGSFDEIGGISARNVARFDSREWRPMGEGFDRSVEVLVHVEGQLLAGGAFERSGEVAAKSIARWNGSAWESMGPGIPGDFPTTRSVAFHAGHWYSAGSYVEPSSEFPNRVAQWNGSEWSWLERGFAGGLSIFAMISFEGQLYAAGSFTDAGGKIANHIASFDGREWQTLGRGNGMDGTVHALHVWEDGLFAGGSFLRAGSVHARSIAWWNGEAWQSMGEGLRGQVWAIQDFDDRLIAGGRFDLPDQVTANVASWSGEFWLPLGQGLDGTVLDLAVFQDKLYAAGVFREGPTRKRQLASWDGSAWQMLDLDLDVRIGDPILQTLEVFQDRLVVGGRFHRLRGLPAENLATFDGVTWLPISPGVNEVVEDLMVLDSNLYVAGFFSETGENGLQQVASWNGASWTPMGNGLLFDNVIASGRVLRLGSYRGRVILGGLFDGVDTVRSANLAAWQAGRWQVLGSGLDGRCLAATEFHQQLFVAGDFGRAGSRYSSHVAVWQDDAAPILSHGFSADESMQGVELRWLLTERGVVETQHVQVWRSQHAESRFVSVTPPRIPHPVMQFTDVPFEDEGTRYYRLEFTGAYGRISTGSYAVRARSFPAVLSAVFEPQSGPVRIRYTLSKASEVRLGIFDVRGRRVRTILPGRQPRGTHVVWWNRETHFGPRAGRGVYFVRLDDGLSMSSRKLILLRDGH